MNLDLYKVLVKELARTLDVQSASNPEVQAAGMVINTMGWVDGVGYEVNYSYLSNFVDVVIESGFSTNVIDHINSWEIDIKVNNVFDQAQLYLFSNLVTICNSLQPLCKLEIVNYVIWKLER